MRQDVSLAGMLPAVRSWAVAVSICRVAALQGKADLIASMQEVPGIQKSLAQLRWQLQPQKHGLPRRALTVEAARLAQPYLPQQASTDLLVCAPFSVLLLAVSFTEQLTVH